jgi:DNA-binding CsgD family transcriptional regulator
MTEAHDAPEETRRNVAAAVEAVLDVRDDDPTLRRIFEHSHVPMVIADAERRFVEVNYPARLWFRLSVREMRTYSIGDLTPRHPEGVMERVWSRLLDAGCVAGRYPVYASDGSQLDVFYYGAAHVMPGLHLIAFAPADWPAPEVDAITDDRSASSATFTPREIQVLALAADGLNGPDIARELSISPDTVTTHLQNAYRKLGVGNRAAAVAKAMRLGVIT